MFVDPSRQKDSPSVEGNGGQSSPMEGYHPDGSTASSAKDSLFWLWFTLNMLLVVICLVLNALLSIVIVVERQKTFKNSFYTIIFLFALTMVIGSFFEVANEIMVEAVNVHAPAINEAFFCIDLVISYFSTILIFFLGLNRFAVFSSPRLNELVMNKKTLRYVLIGSLFASVAISIAVFELSGCTRVFESNVMVDYADNVIFMQVSNYIFYTIPLASSTFYLAVFNSLRHQKADAISSKTKSLLDKAERCSLKQGMWILVIYLASLIIHVMMQLSPPNGFSYMMLSRVQNFTSMAPQLAIPVSVLACSRDARNAAMHLCWSSIKERLSSTFSLPRMHRIGSASSTKALPVTLESST